MTCHIRRSKIAHDKVEFIALDNLGNFVSDTLDAHLGLLVIRVDFGRRHHVTCLSLELLLNTTVEEEGDVGVLLSFYPSDCNSVDGIYIPAI